MDYTDPASARKIRINIERDRPPRSGSCACAETGLRNPSPLPVPYSRVGLTETTLAGQAGAELEYTCGDGDAKRHGIWRAVVRDGKAYHFYLTMPDAQFAESKIIYDELVRSFQFV